MVHRAVAVVVRADLLVALGQERDASVPARFEAGVPLPVFRVEGEGTREGPVDAFAPFVLQSDEHPEEQHLTVAEDGVRQTGNVSGKSPSEMQGAVGRATLEVEIHFVQLIERLSSTGVFCFGLALLTHFVNAIR